MLDPTRHHASLEAFGRLCQIMDTLREQCPWDKKQTLQSLRNLTIEETYELADAILKEDLPGIKEELGDLLLHMVFYARIAEEEGAFSLAEALHHVCDKLIERHPHIYGDLEVDSAEEVKQNWEKIKLRSGSKTVLGGVPDALPAMIKAYRMQEKTAQVGFEWAETAQVWDKVQEELGELQAALQEGESAERVEEEFGDVLFALINYARFIKVDPETALEKVNQKFRRRFNYIEQKAGADMTLMNLDQLDALWNEAKATEKSGD
jgi:XTP/dITP diphosphohydrolase